MTRQKSLWRLLSIAIILLIFSSQLLFASQRNPNQMVAKFSKKISVPDFVESFNGNLLDSIPEANTYLIHFDDVEQLNGMFDKAPTGYNIEILQPNYIWGIPQLEQMSQSFPDETQPVLLMGVSPVNYFGQDNITSTGIDTVHSITTGEEIAVAVIDNGLSFNHPLFIDILPGTGYDFVDSDTNPNEQPGPAYGHGTFVSGIIKLIAPDCNIIPLRAFDEEGLSTSFTIAKAVYFAINQEVDVVNLSFSSTERDMILETAVRQAYISGIALVGASGNDGQDVKTYPASNSLVIGVGALDTLEYRADFSNYGNYLDICAPGVNVYSSLSGDYEWGSWSGTSFATPMVAAACALIKSYEPGASPGYIQNLLKKNARKDLDWGNINNSNTEYGSGCLNILDAVLNAPKDVSSVGGKMIDHDEMAEIIFMLYQANGDIAVPLDKYDHDNSGIVNILDLVYLIENKHKINFNIRQD